MRQAWPDRRTKNGWASVEVRRGGELGGDGRGCCRSEEHTLALAEAVPVGQALGERGRREPGGGEFRGPVGRDDLVGVEDGAGEGDRRAVDGADRAHVGVASGKGRRWVGRGLTEARKTGGLQSRSAGVAKWPARAVAA